MNSKFSGSTIEFASFVKRMLMKNFEYLRDNRIRILLIELTPFIMMHFH